VHTTELLGLREMELLLVDKALHHLRMEEREVVEVGVAEVTRIKGLMKMMAGENPDGGEMMKKKAHVLLVLDD
jgi:hypothetical protein